jgi:hypothetical protein
MNRLADKKKDGGLSNKKKLERRMKIADLKQMQQS